MPSPLEALVQGFQENQANQQRQVQQIASQQAADFERQYKLSMAQQEASHQAALEKNATASLGIQQGAQDRLAAKDKAQAEHQTRLDDFHKAGLKLKEQLAKAGNDTTLRRVAIQQFQANYRKALENSSPEDAMTIAQYSKNVFPEFDTGALPSALSDKIRTAAPGTPGMAQPTVSPSAPPTAPPVDMNPLLKVLHASSQMQGQSPPPVPTTVGDTAVGPNSDVLGMLNQFQAQAQAAKQPPPVNEMGTVQAQYPSQAPPLLAALTHVSPGVAAKIKWLTDRGDYEQAAAELRRAQTSEVKDVAQAKIAHEKAMTALYGKKGTAQDIENAMAKRKGDLDMKLTQEKINQMKQNEILDSAAFTQKLSEFEYKKISDAVESADQTTGQAGHKAAAAAYKSWFDTSTKLLKDGIEVRADIEANNRKTIQKLQAMKNPDTGQLYTPAEAAKRRQELDQDILTITDHLNGINAQREAAAQNANTFKGLMNSTDKITETSAGGSPVNAAQRKREADRAIRQGVQANDPRGTLPPASIDNLADALKKQEELKRRGVFRNNSVVHGPGYRGGQSSASAKKKETAAEVKKRLGL